MPKRIVTMQGQIKFVGDTQSNGADNQIALDTLHDGRMSRAIGKAIEEVMGDGVELYSDPHLIFNTDENRYTWTAQFAVEGGDE